MARIKTKKMGTYAKATVDGDTKCTTKLINKVVQFLLVGNYIEVACQACGIDKRTFYNWLKWGNERPRSIYRRFSDAVLDAQAKAEANALANIERAAKGTTHALLLKDENGDQLFDQHGLPLFIKPQPPDWQAEAWRLERKFAQRWSKIERQEVTTNQGPLVQIVLPSNARELPIEVKAIEPGQSDANTDIPALPDICVKKG